MNRRMFLMASFALPAVGRAQNFAGIWKATYRTPDGYVHESTLELQIEDAKVGGKVFSSRGSVPITDGEISGSRIAFRVVRRGNGAEFDVRFTGTVDGDVMKLAMEYPDHDPVDIVARREAQEKKQ